MKSSAKNIRLMPVDDLFSSEESRADANRERVVELSLAELHPFKNHPFKVLDHEKMLLLLIGIAAVGGAVFWVVRQKKINAAQQVPDFEDEYNFEEDENEEE